MSNWTQPGQGFKGLDEKVEAISEQQVMSYFDKLLEQDEEQLVELLGKIKGKIKNFKDKRDFKKRAGELAKHHGDQSDHHGKSKDHHDDHHQAHDSAGSAMHNHGHGEKQKTKTGFTTPERKGKNAAASRKASGHHWDASGSHKAASGHHDSAKKAHELAKNAAKKGDHEAYKKHSQAAKDHAQRAKSVGAQSNQRSNTAELGSQHADSGDRDYFNHLKKKHGGNK